MPRVRYSIPDLINAVKNNYSIRRVLLSLGLNATGSAYDSIKHKISCLNLDISHFTGQSSNRGKTFAPKRHINDYLSNLYYIGSHNLKIV